MTDTTSTAAARMAALGLTPSTDEVAQLDAIAPLILGGLQQLHAVDLDVDTRPAVCFSAFGDREGDSHYPPPRSERTMATIEPNTDPDAPDGVLVLLELRAAQQNRQPLISVLESMIPSTRAAEGCRSIAVYERPGDDATTVVLIEHWDSLEHYERYVAWRRDRGDLRTLMAATDGAPLARVLRSLDV